jgi:hypothetical protein
VHISLSDVLENPDLTAMALLFPYPHLDLHPEIRQ